MEITHEIKCKVFAQYWGQKIAKFENHPNIDLVDDVLIDGCYINRYKLIIKPLLAITDEDAIQVCKLQQEFKEQTGIKVGFHIDEKNSGCLDCIIEWDGYKHDYFQPVYSQTYQYLQSKGYDLPQYFLEGRTLHEAGLAIYE